MYDYDREQVRHQIRQRYNRKFFLAGHVGITLVLLVLASFVPFLGFLPMASVLLLIPHAIYVLYFEYQRWLERRIDRELYPDEDIAYSSTQKSKRYADDEAMMAQQASFRLTDDGELEPIAPHTTDGRKRKPQMWQDERHDERYEDSKAYKRRRKDEKKFRKRDTDEFDIKKLLKKVKDILD